jgi:DNA-directed RNA polymerase subunit K
MMEKYTKYEEARMVGARSLQIAMGAPFTLKISDLELAKMRYNPVEIAKLEFRQGLIPMTIKRPMPRDLSEVQAPQEAPEKE